MKFQLGLNGEPIRDRVSPMFTGVGLIRGEYLCRREGEWITSERCQEAIRLYCDEVARIFDPDPVWYRLIEMESSEINLFDDVDHRIVEKTTMLGLRGVRRALRFPETFALEAGAVAAAARRRPNLNVLIPFVQGPREVEQVCAQLAAQGFANGVGIMAEIPSAIFLLDDCIAAGASHVTVGLNDLTGLVLGAERRSDAFSPLHPAVLALAGMALEKAARRNLAAVAAGSITPELVTALRERGFENFVLHYSELERFAPDAFAGLAGTIDLDRMMGEVRDRVRLSAPIGRQDGGTAPAEGADPGANARYMASLSASLIAEVDSLAPACPGVRLIEPECRRLDRLIGSLDLASRHDHWLAACATYREVGDRLADQLNRVASIARCYPSMDAFWADAAAQAEGESPFTFWDSFEHGRRRQLERILAEVYAAEDALLLNAGMSAIVTAIEAADLRPGDRVVTGMQSYFETSEYLEDRLTLRGVELIRLPIGDPAAMRTALAGIRPRLVLFETATNGPSLDVPDGLEAWLGTSPESWFVCDNTLQGPLTPWFGDPRLAHLLPENFLVVESATKYLSQTVMAGIVYGRRALVEKARLVARLSGQHLQEKAFNHLREGNLRHVGQRLALHSRNARLIAERITAAPRRAFEPRQPACSKGEIDLFERGSGGLLFVLPAHPAGGAEAAEACRALLTRWQAQVARHGHELPVRAGFGWTGTSARIYESGALNQRDAPCYLRIAVGIEPEPTIRRLADSLAAALEKGA